MISVSNKLPGQEDYFCCRYITFLDMDEIIAPTADEPINSLIHRAESAYPSAGAFMLMTSWHWSDTQKLNIVKVESPKRGSNFKEKEEIYSKPQAESSLLIFSIQQHSFGSQPSLQDPKSIVSTDRVITVSFNEALDVSKKDYRSVLLPHKQYGLMHHFKGRCENRFNFIVCDEMSQRTKTYTSVSRHFKKTTKSSNIVLKHLQLI